jgi:hypothetical protein
MNKTYDARRTSVPNLNLEEVDLRKKSRERSLSSRKKVAAHSIGRINPQQLYAKKSAEALPYNNINE